MDRKAEYLLALARLQAKNPNWAKRAIETCRAALEIDPHSADARFQLGELYEQSADFGRARAQYTAAVRENPNHLQALAKLRELKDSQEARKVTGGGLFDRLFGRRDEG
ncbi:MAG: tetratricopeptide repeat protein [Thermoanaerobaculia bacterium]